MALALASMRIAKKLALAPSPTVTTVLARNRCLSTVVTGGSIPTQGLSGEVHSYQIHRMRSALLKRSRSSIPSPPKCFGLIDFAHFTKQCPPLASADPFHRKFLLSLSILLIAHFCSLNTVMESTMRGCIRSQLLYFTLDPVYLITSQIIILSSL